METTFYLVKSLFQSFNLQIHSAEAQTAACTLTGWCYQLITNPLPPILWHKQTALQINHKKNKKKIIVQWGSFMLGVCVMLSVTSQSDNEMSTPSGRSLDREVDVRDCYSSDQTLLCWMSHSKSSQKAIFPFEPLQPDTSGEFLDCNFLRINATSHVFWGLKLMQEHKMRSRLRKEQQPLLTGLFNGTEMALLLPPVLIFFKL